MNARLAVSALAFLIGILPATAADIGTIPHASNNSLTNNLTVKTARGALVNYNCTAITGGSAGFCVAYDSAFVPPTGALSGANVIDVCYFDTSARGCSFARLSAGPDYVNGIQILVTTAATPFTYTTGTATAFIEADYQ